MALFDTPRIFKTPAEEANEAASRVSALGLGQLFAHAFEGAQARAQQQLQFEEQMAQRKIEYQNNLDRLKQQQQLETDKWELGKKLENLQINQLQNKIDEDKAFADDLTVFQSWQKTLNEDPWAPIPLDAIKSDKGKQFFIEWRQNKINNDIQMAFQKEDIDTRRSLSTQGIQMYDALVADLRAAAVNGQSLVEPLKKIAQFKRDAAMNPEMRNPYYGGGFNPTARTGLAANDLLDEANTLEESGDIAGAERLRRTATAMIRPGEMVHPTMSQYELIKMRRELKAVDNKLSLIVEKMKMRGKGPDDPEYQKAEQDAAAEEKAIMDRYNASSSRLTAPEISVSPEKRSMLEREFNLKPVDWNQLRNYK